MHTPTSLADASGLSHWFYPYQIINSLTITMTFHLGEMQEKTFNSECSVLSVTLHAVPSPACV